MRIVEGLVTNVGDDHGVPQVLQSVDISVKGQWPNIQAESSRDSNRRSDEGGRRSAEGREEHCDETSWGG